MKQLINTLMLMLLTYPVWSQATNQVFTLNSVIKGSFQTDDGFIWLTTASKMFRWDGHDLLTLSDIYAEDVKEINQIRTLFKDSQGQIWVGTQNNGLFKLAPRGIQPIHADQLTTKVHYKITQANGWMWSVTDQGLIRFNETEWNLYTFDNFDELKTDGIIMDLDSDDESLFILKTNQLIEFNLKQEVFKSHNTPLAGLYRSLSLNYGLTLVTDNGLFRSEDFNDWQVLIPELSDKKIRSIKKIDGKLWVITISDGIYLYDEKLIKINHYKTSSGPTNKLSSDTVTDLFIDRSGLIWVFHFNGAVDTLDPKQESFGLNKLSKDKVCQLDESYLDMTEDDNHYWIASQSGIQKINKDSGLCQLIDSDILGNDMFAASVPNSLDHTPDTGVLIGSSNGIYQIRDNEHLEIFNNNIRFINFITHTNGQWFLGAFEGLFILDPVSNKAEIVTNSENIEFYDHTYAPNSDSWYFATNNGLFLYQDSRLKPLKSINDALGIKLIHSILSYQDHLFLGLAGAGLVNINLSNNSITSWAETPLGPERITLEIIEAENSLWISTDDGLFQASIDGKNIKQYTEQNGLQSNGFKRNTGFLSSSGQLFFGGVKGYNYFHPKEISFNKTPPLINFTRIKRFNEPVLIGQDKSDFQLSQELNHLDQLVLTYQDYVMSFEFSAMDFTNPNANRYQHRLYPFEDKWNLTQATQRSATYTNLPSGHFELQVRASNNEDIWSDTTKTLKIKVLPPPWLTWWAISAYVLLALFSIYWYVQRKIKTNKAIAEQLRLDVAEKTKELNIQKQTVESLLVKKNELFSNVSHEFRTPLTLILGPIKELINKQVDQEDTRSLKMINRSANRLLSLVEQLLQIARVSDTEQVKTTPQNTQNQVASLVESFQYLADSKHIKLELKHNDQATIDVTDQFIDAVLGNLVSNAIKYTQSGGHVEVTSVTTEDSLVLSVNDSGAGLTAEQQKDIFKRFKRLDSHQAIEGIGIGLSVVEEVVKVNNGDIEVKSELGVGSEFIVRIPLAEAVAEIDSSHISTLIEQLQSESIEAKDATTNLTESSENRDLNTVLIIEDNHDMREHIVSIVSPHYNCITAENGVKGVAAAIEEVPDIIISDVMMPEMDGFKVARVIRADQRTSHIPLMLLTALNDKVSRIKGWRENVDAYMAKPFDRDELLVQLENMLTIRDILKTKAGQEVKSGKSTSKVLPKKDQEFVDQLIQVIEENYMDPILNRAKIASKMAVSDRQLQRKIKALIDQNPMDMLREYRLNKSKELLKDGYQVGIVADNCGFNSVSYFSQCFKAQFGMTAKTYQQTAK